MSHIIVFVFLFLLPRYSALELPGRLCYNFNNGQNLVHTNKGKAVRFGQPPQQQVKLHCQWDSDGRSQLQVVILPGCSSPLYLVD